MRCCAFVAGQHISIIVIGANADLSYAGNKRRPLCPSRLFYISQSEIRETFPIPFVILAKAGIHGLSFVPHGDVLENHKSRPWIPAFAGMTISR